MKNRQIYFDGAANTAVSPEVFKAMKPYITNNYQGNSHAIHDYGIKSMTVIEECREKCSKILHCQNHHSVYFTSGATEGNNWVIKSLAYHERTKESKRRNTIICSAVEHSSVYNTCKQLAEEGFNIVYVKPNKKGRILSSEFEKTLTNDAFLACIMATNNETGVTNCVEVMAQKAHRKNIMFLADCTQAISGGGVYTALCEINPSVDYMTFSGHKIYGPTGTGILIRKNSAPLYPLLVGGAQEEGLRGGTHNLAGIVGITTALEQMKKHDHWMHYYTLMVYMKDQLAAFNEKYHTNIHINGYEPEKGSIINLNCYSALPSTSLASDLALRGVCVSAGSACDANAESIPSHVLLAMGVKPEEIGSCIRISFTKDTTLNDLKKFFIILSKMLEEKNESC